MKNEIISFLNGNTKVVTDKLIDQMNKYSEKNGVRESIRI